MRPKPVMFWINDSMKAICMNCGHSINYHNPERIPLCFYENCDCKEAEPRIIEMNGENYDV